MCDSSSNKFVSPESKASNPSQPTDMSNKQADGTNATPSLEEKPSDETQPSNMNNDQTGTINAVVSTESNEPGPLQNSKVSDHHAGQNTTPASAEVKGLDSSSLCDMPLRGHMSPLSAGSNEKLAEFATMSSGVTSTDSAAELNTPVSPVSSAGRSDDDAYNPFELVSKGSVKIKNDELLNALNFNAVELSVEYFGNARMDLFSNPDYFVALFTESLQPGCWDVLDRSEGGGHGEHIRFIKKFRLRAGTEVDRQERVMIGIFAERNSNERLIPTNGIGYEEFTVSELLRSKQMIIEKKLKSNKRSENGKSTILLALDMICHVDHDERITFDFGFLEGAPRRNRMFFVLSRALRRGKWSPVFRSEIRLREDVTKFDAVTLSAQELHGGDSGKLFRIEVYRAYKNGKSKLLGFVQTSFEKLASMECNDQLYWWPAQDGIIGAKVLIQDLGNCLNESWFCLRLARHP